MDLNQITDAVKQAVSAEVAPIKAEVEALKHGGPVATDNAKGITGASQPSRTSKAAVVRHRIEAFRQADTSKGVGLGAGAFMRALASVRREGYVPSHENIAKRLAEWGYEEYADLVSDFAKVYAMDGQSINIKVLGESTVSSGGALVIPQWSNDIIGLLRAKVVLLDLGVRDMSMPGGQLTLRKQTSGATAYYTGESTAVTPSTQGTGTVSLSAKKLMAITAVTNELLVDANPDADALVRDDIVQVLRLRADLALIRGTGGEFQPRGLRYWANAANITAATSGAGPTLAQVTNDLMDLKGGLEDNNVSTDKSQCAFVMAPRTRRFLETLRDGVGGYVFKDELASNMLLGYPVRDTTAIPTNLGVGSDESEIYFVNKDECVHGQTGGLEISFHPDGTWDDSGTARSGLSRDESVFRGKMRHDFVVRHDYGVAVKTGVQWST